MTFENSKRLYEHYVEIGYIKAAENMLKKHPEFKKEVKVEKPEEKDNSKKSK